MAGVGFCIFPLSADRIKATLRVCLYGMKWAHISVTSIWCQSRSFPSHVINNQEREDGIRKSCLEVVSLIRLPQATKKTLQWDLYLQIKLGCLIELSLSRIATIRICACSPMYLVIHCSNCLNLITSSSSQQHHYLHAIHSNEDVFQE